MSEGTAIKCKHCGSTNLDLEHIFPKCLNCDHFLPSDVTRKSAAVAKSIEFEMVQSGYTEEVIRRNFPKSSLDGDDGTDGI